MSEMNDRWLRFKETLRPFRVVKPPEPEEPPPVEPLAEIVKWASDTNSRDFIKYLDEWADRAELRARLAYLNHAETSFWLGYSSALEALREHFTAWRDNRPPAPQKGIMP